MKRPDDFVVPCDFEAELFVIGACVMNGEETVIEVTPIVKPADFLRETNRWAFEAILALYDRHEGIDLITVRRELERMGRAGEVEITTLMTAAADPYFRFYHAAHYARIVADRALDRRLIDAGTKLAHTGYDDGLTAEGKKDRAAQIVDAAVDGVADDGFTRLSDVVLRMDNRRWNDAAREPAISTALSDLDDVMGGLHRADMTVVAGVSGHGKTSLLNTIAWNVAAAGVPVAYFSLEMKDERIHDRILRILTGIPFNRLQLPGRNLRPDEVDAITTAMGQMSEAPLYLSDRRGQTVEAIARKARQLHRREKLGLIVVDFMQLVETARGDLEGRTGELDHIAYRLYDLAGELDCHVLCASQLVKADFVSAPPTIDKVRGSGAIVHAANNVVFVWRDERMPDTGEAARLTRLHIGKQREGRLGEVNVGWYGARSMFVNVTQIKSINAEARRAA